MKNLLVPPTNRAAQPSEASLYIYGPIGPYDDYDEISAMSVAKALNEVGGAKTINTYINSVGGSVFEGVAIYQQLRRFSGTIIVHIDSIAASIASVIAMAGSEIRMGYNAQMMIHNPQGMAWGEEDDIRAYADILKGTKETLLDTYVARTKQQRATISAWMNAETWMNADTCLKNGFCDRKVSGNEDVEMDARSKVILAKYKHAPKDIALPRESAARAMVASARMRVMMDKLKSGGQSANSSNK